MTLPLVALVISVLALVLSVRSLYIQRRCGRAQSAYSRPDYRSDPDVQWFETFQKRGPFWRGFLGLPVQR